MSIEKEINKLTQQLLEDWEEDIEIEAIKQTQYNMEGKIQDLEDYIADLSDRIEKIEQSEQTEQTEYLIPQPENRPLSSWVKTKFKDFYEFLCPWTIVSTNPED